MRLPGGDRAVALTPLIAAVTAGCSASMAALLDAGADVHQKCAAAAAGADSADWSSALSAAVLRGDEALVQQLVAAGACGGRGGGAAVGRDHPALRAVALAARQGRADLLHLLFPPLEAALPGGSAAMLCSLKRRTALHPLAAAAQGGHLAAVDALLALGAPPRHDSSLVAGVAQHTPLMLAAANGHAEVVSRLLAAGACPLATNAHEHTAAAMALRRGHLGVLGRLLRHNGELAAPRGVVQPAGGGNGAEAAGAAAAPWAAPADAGPSVRPQMCNVSKAWQMGFAAGVLPRHRPCTLGELQQERQHYQLLLAALLEAHARGGPPAASSAAARVRALVGPAELAHAAAGSAQLLDALLACGASLACVSPADGGGPLLAAAHHGWLALQRLLELGADPRQADAGGGTLLHLMASRPALLEPARALLAWHAALPPHRRRLDPLQRDAAGRDALGVALAAGNRLFGAELLMHLTAEQGRAAGQGQATGQGTGPAGPSATLAPAPAPTGRDRAGAAAAAAYDLLASLGAACLADVNRPGADGQHELVRLVRAGSAKQLRAALALPGIDADAREPASGRTPLMLAAARRHEGMVRELLACGRAALDARDAAGCTAALLAARAGSIASLRLLLGAGADVGLADSDGTTPLMLLAAGGQHKVAGEVLRARPAAALLSAQDKRGWTALHHAAAAGAAGACRVLRAWGADPTQLTERSRSTAHDLARRAGHVQCLPMLALPGDAAAHD